MALADVGPEIAEMTVTRGRVIFRGFRSRASALQREGRKAANLKDKRDSQHAITSNYLKINVSGSDPKLITARLFINVIICTQSVEADYIHQHLLYTPAIRWGIILR